MDNNTNQLLINADVERRVQSLEEDMKMIKPIVYSTEAAVKNIEQSVKRMEINSDKIRGYFWAAMISGIVGILFIAVQKFMGGEWYNVKFKSSFQ